MNSYVQMQVDELIKKVEKFSYIKFGIALFIALTCSTLVSDLIEWKVADLYLKKVAAELEQKARAEEKIIKQQLEAEAKNMAARNAEIARQQENYQAEQKRIANANRIRNENAAEAQKKLMETCQFWITEFNKSRTEGDKNHRDVACRTAGMPFN